MSKILTMHWMYGDLDVMEGDGTSRGVATIILSDGQYRLWPAPMGTTDIVNMAEWHAEKRLVVKTMLVHPDDFRGFVRVAMPLPSWSWKAP